MLISCFLENIHKWTKMPSTRKRNNFPVCGESAESQEGEGARVAIGAKEKTE